MSDKKIDLFNQTSRPHHLLALFALLFFIISFFKKGEGFDLNLHDTYIVITGMNLYRIFVAMLIFLWVIYLMISKVNLWFKSLIWLHVLFTIFPMGVFLLAQQAHWPGNSMDGLNRRYYAFTDFKERQLYDFATIYISALIVFICGQVIF